MIDLVNEGLCACILFPLSVLMWFLCLLGTVVGGILVWISSLKVVEVNQTTLLVERRYFGWRIQRCKAGAIPLGIVIW